MKISNNTLDGYIPNKQEIHSIHVDREGWAIVKLWHKEPELGKLKTSSLHVKFTGNFPVFSWAPLFEGEFNNPKVDQSGRHYLTRSWSATWEVPLSGLNEKNEKCLKEITDFLKSCSIQSK